MYPPESKEDLVGRVTKAKQDYDARQQMITWMRESYTMEPTRTSSFLGSTGTSWRRKAAKEYMVISNRPHNVVDLMTAVLSGNPIQYTITQPGQVISPLPSRAEKFLEGVWLTNSMRQQTDVYQKFILNTVLDGSCGLKIYWNPNYSKPTAPRTILTDDEDHPVWLVATYEVNEFPIVIEVIPATKLYPIGRGALGRPFDEIIHEEMRTPADILYEWEDVEGVESLDFLTSLKREHQRRMEKPYVEWWGKDAKGVVHHAVLYMNQWVLRPRPTEYPEIPYIVSTFKDYETDSVSYKRLPFLFSIVKQVDREEYVASRMFRNIDVYANLPPVHKGDAPVQWQGTWGKTLHMGREDALEFPRWPGTPPDIYRFLQDLRQAEEEGTFSAMMFGQASTRMSGYAMSQAIGADTIRTDTPKRNLELTMGIVAMNIFGLLQTFAADDHIAITGTIGDRDLSSMLAGYETTGLVVQTFIKPKHVADDVRMAALGAQLSSLPQSPLSMYTILQRYFGIQQPEDELDRKRSETALQHPVVQLLAILDVLKENNSPYVPFIEQMLQEAMGKMTAGAGGPGGPGGPEGQMPGGQPPPGIEGVGLGLPQALMGNMPMPGQFGGGPTEEGMPTRETMMAGGPTEARPY